MCVYNRMVLMEYMRYIDAAVNCQCVYIFIMSQFRYTQQVVQCTRRGTLRCTVYFCVVTALPLSMPFFDDVTGTLFDATLFLARFEGLAVAPWAK